MALLLPWGDVRPIWTLCLYHTPGTRASLRRCARPAGYHPWVMVAPGPKSAARSTWNGPWAKPLNTFFGLLVRGPLYYALITNRIWQLWSWSSWSLGQSIPPGDCSLYSSILTAHLVPMVDPIWLWSITYSWSSWKNRLFSNSGVFYADWNIWLKLSTI